MFDRASKKLGLEQAVLGTFEKDKDDDKPSNEEMEQLLKKGAYALLEDDNDQITKQFCADDIESILAKRTRTRVVEGTKTSSWLNKQGMMVSKSKFTSEEGVQIDMDDPLFWQKVMPDFVTPSILLQKFNDLHDEITGTIRGPGRGRGRGRKKKLPEKPEAETPLQEETEDVGTTAQESGGKVAMDIDSAEKENKDDDDHDDDENVKELLADETLEDMSDDGNDEDANGKKIQLSRAHLRKINKFMSDLKSCMESIFEEDDEEGLASDEKNVCQKLLLTISVKERIFNEEQRRLARALLKRLEGDRRRRCRTSEQPRFQPGYHEDEPTARGIPGKDCTYALLIILRARCSLLMSIHSPFTAFFSLLYMYLRGTDDQE